MICGHEGGVSDMAWIISPTSSPSPLATSLNERRRTVAKAAIIVLADTEMHEGLGRSIHKPDSHGPEVIVS
jgi:hypothetical protein